MIRARITKDGRLAIGHQAMGELKKYPNTVIEMRPILPESNKMRGYFEGALVPYFAFVHGMDWKDRAVLEDARYAIKDEFWSEVKVIAGKSRKMPKSTKGREALKTVVERLLEYLAENGYYSEACEPAKYKHWRDVILTEDPESPDDFIDYLIQTGALRIPQLSPAGT